MNGANKNTHEIPKYFVRSDPSTQYKLYKYIILRTSVVIYYISRRRPRERIGINLMVKRKKNLLRSNLNEITNLCAKGNYYSGVEFRWLRVRSREV